VGGKRIEEKGTGILAGSREGGVYIFLKSATRKRNRPGLSKK